MVHHRSRTVAVLTTGTLALAACGGDAPDEDADATPEPTASATAEPAPAQTEESAPADQNRPEARTYRVKEGDSLFAIAQRFDTSVRALVRLNKIDDPHLIKIGQELKIPGPGE